MPAVRRAKLFATDEERYQRDHELRVLGVPHRMAGTAINTSQHDAMWSQYDRVTSAEDPKGRPMKRASALDCWGIPAMKERYILSIPDAPRAPRPRAWLTVAEVAQLRGMTPHAVRDAIARGNLHAPRADVDTGHYQISMAAFESWYARCGHTPVEVAAIMASAHALERPVE